MAAEAYVKLAAGDRRRGATLLTRALAEDPDEPNAPQWRADLKRLKKRWSLDAWVLLRDGGATNVATAAPVLGGGQSGSTLAYTFDPLAKQPVSLLGRLSIASVGKAFRNARYDPGTQQYALGLAWRPVPWAQLSAERLIAGGYLARNAFAVRAAAGGRQSLELSADWRFRVAGNSLPGSGPAVTLVTRY